MEQQPGPVDPLASVGFYTGAVELWDLAWDDCKVLARDFRGHGISKQLIRSVGLISASIEEGFGRGFRKEYPHFLRVARGSARESKGWYQRARRLLPERVLAERVGLLDQIIGAVTKAIRTIEAKNAQAPRAGYVREPDIEWQ